MLPDAIPALLLPEFKYVNAPLLDFSNKLNMPPIEPSIFGNPASTLELYEKFARN